MRIQVLILIDRRHNGRRRTIGGNSLSFCFLLEHRVLTKRTAVCNCFEIFRLSNQNGNDNFYDRESNSTAK